MIRVLLERRVKKEDYDKLIGHLQDLRAAALYQPGYVTGETLVKDDDLTGIVDVLVISTWISEDRWNAWLTSQERIEVDGAITHLLVGEPEISIYKLLGQEV